MLDSFALSDKGCVRANNEDYCLVRPELGLYILADGMGGAKAGERASRLAVDTVAEIVTSAGRRDSQVLLSAVEEANRQVMDAANSDPNMEGMGTTLVAALETDEGVAIASVGDSRAYILDEKGLRVITQDQTWVNDVGRPLGLDEESLRSHPLRHVLTMAIGAGTPLAINYYIVRPSPAALMMICSDGLHGVLDRSLMEEILRARGNGTDSLEHKCQRLIQEAKNAGGPDNITAVLMRAPGAPDLPEPAGQSLRDTQPI
jgi:protein phosphatase